MGAKYKFFNIQVILFNICIRLNNLYNLFKIIVNIRNLKVNSYTYLSIYLNFYILY